MRKTFYFILAMAYELSHQSKILISYDYFIQMLVIAIAPLSQCHCLAPFSFSLLPVTLILKKKGSLSTYTGCQYLCCQGMRNEKCSLRTHTYINYFGCSVGQEVGMAISSKLKENPILDPNGRGYGGVF